MYKNYDAHQISLFDFNQSFGTTLDADNPWVVCAGEIDWKAMEARYAAMFPSRTGRPAAPFRMVLGALIIQEHLGLSDRALVKAIAEDPYLQYFIGQPQYENRAPFNAGSLSKFRRRFCREYLQEINDLLPEGLRIAMPELTAVIDIAPAPEQAASCAAAAYLRARHGADTEIRTFANREIFRDASDSGIEPAAAVWFARTYLDAVDAQCTEVACVGPQAGALAASLQALTSLTGVPLVCPETDSA